jgi:TonB family protein
MARNETFGKFVLLEEIDGSAVGSEYRAAQLGPAGFEKIVSILRIKPALSASGELANNLLDQVKAAAQIQNPNAVKIFGIGKVDATYYVSSEFLEGKSLKIILERCRSEAFPFSVNYALLIANKICTALAQAHAHHSETGSLYFHGLVAPTNVVVTYEGEVRLRGFGYWPSRIREAGAFDDEDQRYLSPEQAAGDLGDTRSDVFAVGALLYEMLTGQPLFAEGRTGDPAAKVASAKLWNSTSDHDALPKPIADILRRVLAADPAARPPQIQEMRNAIDNLLLSRDSTPSAVNLAFLLHTLFREEIVRESRKLKEEKQANYIEYLTDEPARPGSAASGAALHAGAPYLVSVGAAVASPAATVSFPAPPPAPAPKPKAAQPAAVHLEAPPAPTAAHAAASASVSPAVAASEAAVDFTLDRQVGKRGPVRAVVIAAIVLLASVGGWLLLRWSAPPPAPATPLSTLSADEVTVMQRIRELEEKLSAIEQENAAAAQAAEDAKKKLEARVVTRGEKVDAAAVGAPQGARREAHAQPTRAQEEKWRLEEERKGLETRLAQERRRIAEDVAKAAAVTPEASAQTPPTTRAAEEQRRAAEDDVAKAAPVTPAVPAQTPPTTLAADTPPPPPAVKPGTLVSMSEPGVVAPVAQTIPPLAYPPIAERLRLGGTVELSILVDERGNVADVKIVTGAGGRAGLDEAAMDNVKKRQYRPATKNGVPVKVWYPVNVKFVLPKG